MQRLSRNVALFRGVLSRGSGRKIVFANERSRLCRSSAPHAAVIRQLASRKAASGELGEFRTRNRRRKREISSEERLLQARLVNAKSAKDVYAAIDDFRDVLCENAVCISTALHRLGRLPSLPAERSAQERLVEAMQLLGKMLEQPGVLERCEPRGISNVLWACARRGVRLQGLFERLGQRAAKPGFVAKWNSQDVANALWAHATLGLREPYALLLLSHFGRPSILSTAQSQHIAMVLWAMATLELTAEGAGPGEGLRDDEFGEVAITLLRQLATPEVLSICPPQDISKSLWAVAKILQPATVPALVEPGYCGVSTASRFEYFDDVVFTLLERLTKPEALKDATPQNVSNVLWAVAKLGVKDASSTSTFAEGSEDAWTGTNLQTHQVPQFVKILCEHLLEPSNLRVADGQALSNTLWALATLDYAPPFAVLFCNAIGRWLLAHDALVETFTSQNAKDVLWASARLGVWNEELFERLGRHLLSSWTLRTATSEGLVMSLWAHAKSGISNPELFRTVGHAFRQSERMGSNTARQVAVCLWAHAKLGYFQPRLFVELSRHLVQKDVLSSASSQALANVIWSYGALRLDPEEEMWTMLIDAIFTSAERHDVTAQALCNVLWAQASLNLPATNLLEAPITIGTFSDPMALSRMKDRLPQGIANLLWVLAVSETFQPRLCAVALTILLQCWDPESDEFCTDLSHVRTAHQLHGFLSTTADAESQLLAEADAAAQIVESVVDSGVQVGYVDDSSNVRPIVPGVLGRFMSSARQSYIHSIPLERSKMQIEVARMVEQLGYSVEEKRLLEDVGYVADIFIASENVVVEVIGPSHHLFPLSSLARVVQDVSAAADDTAKAYASFVYEQFLLVDDVNTWDVMRLGGLRIGGATHLRRRTLELRGLKVASIAFDDWLRLPGPPSKAMYLEDLIKGAVQSSSSGCLSERKDCQ